MYIIILSKALYVSNKTGSQHNSNQKRGFTNHTTKKVLINLKQRDLALIPLLELAG